MRIPVYESFMIGIDALNRNIDIDYMLTPIGSDSRLNRYKLTTTADDNCALSYRNSIELRLHQPIKEGVKYSADDAETLKGKIADSMRICLQRVIESSEGVCNPIHDMQIDSMLKIIIDSLSIFERGGYRLDSAV